MSEPEKPPVGTIGWIDLTVSDAETLRDFYQDVVGWAPQPVPMGDYADFNMTQAESGLPMAGICHARGPNEGLPPQWVIYITVDNLDRSVERCEALGGRVIFRPESTGEHGRFCIIRDPAGAVCALFQPAGA